MDTIMNPTQEHLNDLRQRAVKILNDVCRGHRFTWGRPAHWCDGGCDVSVDRIWDDDGNVEHLVTVHAGLPLGPALEGLVCTVRRADTGAAVEHRTDWRGQVWLTALEPGEYGLQFQAPQQPVVFRLDPPFAERVLPEPLLAMAAHTGEGAVQEFHSPDGKRLAWLRVPGEHVVLGMEVAPELLGDRLVRFEVLDAAGHSLLTGYVGLYVVGGKGYGEILVNRLVRGFGGGPERPGEAVGTRRDLYLRFEPHAFRDLTAADRETLERSRRATDHPDSRAVLDEALRRLPAP